MKLTKFRIIKRKNNYVGVDYCYHVERWRWYWPFWSKVSPVYGSKQQAKDHIEKIRMKK